MKRLLFLAATAAFVAGCGENEAKRFGYKGADLQDDAPMFFSTGPTVTNWVPARVLSVVEDYPMSPDEEALIAAAGVVTPSGTFEKIPEGYSKSVDEPWFANWTKEAENLGRKGVNGFIAHFNEDRNVWEAGETYFSSYYPAEAEALAALAETRKLIGERFHPKKFYDFDRCWVAEYLRLRVLCIVGQKADGTWSCMLDIQDKNLSGCGQWEPVDAQEMRLAEYKYRKAVKAWSEAKAKVLADNHEVVEKARRDKGLALLGENARLIDSGDGRKALMAFGSCDAASVTNRMEFWKARADALAAATGVVFEGEPAVEEVSPGFALWNISAASDLYEVRLDMAFQSAEEKSEEEAKPDGEQEPAASPIVEWREICTEKMQPGFEIPPRPQPPETR